MTAPTQRDVLATIRDLIEAGDGIRCYPSGAVGFDDWDEARDKAQLLIGQWVDEEGEWRSTTDNAALTRREPLDVERLADWMMENLPRVHRWMMVGWRDTMRDEAVALMREAAEYATWRPLIRRES